MKTTTRTVGIYSLHCACGREAKILDVLERTRTGRETIRHFCHQCKCVSWWWRRAGTPERVMLIDREERPPGKKCWPPAGWTRRHMPKQRGQ